MAYLKYIDSSSPNSHLFKLPHCFIEAPAPTLYYFYSTIFSLIFKLEFYAALGELAVSLFFVFLIYKFRSSQAERLAVC